MFQYSDMYYGTYVAVPRLCGVFRSLGPEYECVCMSRSDCDRHPIDDLLLLF